MCVICSIGVTGQPVLSSEESEDLREKVRRGRKLEGLGLEGEPYVGDKRDIEDAGMIRRVWRAGMLHARRRRDIEEGGMSTAVEGGEVGVIVICRGTRVGGLPPALPERVRLPDKGSN